MRYFICVSRRHAKQLKQDQSRTSPEPYGVLAKRPKAICKANGWPRRGSSGRRDVVKQRSWLETFFGFCQWLAKCLVWYFNYYNLCRGLVCAINVSCVGEGGRVRAHTSVTGGQKIIAVFWCFAMGVTQVRGSTCPEPSRKTCWK